MRQSCTQIRHDAFRLRARGASLGRVAGDVTGRYALLLAVSQRIDSALFFETMAKRPEGQFGGENSWRKCHKTFENVRACSVSNLPSKRNPY